MKRTLCDVVGCRGDSANQLSMFKERKKSGSGSMENWYYTFDLCAAHEHLFLGALLEKITVHSNGIDSSHILDLINNFKIKTRVA